MITCIFLWKIKIRRHKIKNTNRVAFRSLDLERERFTKTELNLSKYLLTDMMNISQLFVFFLGRCAKIVFACSTNSLQRHYQNYRKI